jgi:hypothetical protein
MAGKWLAQRGCRLRGGLIAGLLTLVLGSWLACTGPTATAAPVRLLSVARPPASRDWPAYLNWPLHSSFAPAQTAYHAGERAARSGPVASRAGAYLPGQPDRR